MNQINKILSGLKKRRAAHLPGEPSAGTTPVWKGRGRQALIGLVVLVGGGVAGGLWWAARHKTVAPAAVVQAPAKPIATPQPVVVPPTAAQAEVSGQISEEAAASQPAVEAVRADSSSEGKAQAEKAPQENASKESAPKENPVNEQGQEKENVAIAVAAETSPPVAASPKPHARTGRTKREKHEKAVSSPEPENMAADDESNITAPAPEGGVEKQIKPLTVQEQANNEYIKANDLLQQGHIREALAGYETALQLEPGHEAARQALVVLLLQNKRNADAERVLQDGLKQNIKNSGFAMLLARIQLDRNASWSALLTLQKTLPYASQQADYQAFVAALLQRLKHHKEAVIHYQAAVELAPDSGVWWMGMGISLRALQRTEEARIAFRRALESHSLNGDLRAFVSNQLKEL